MKFNLDFIGEQRWVLRALIFDLEVAIAKYQVSSDGIYSIVPLERRFPWFSLVATLTRITWTEFILRGIGIIAPIP